MTGTRTTPPTIARDDAHNGMPRQQPLNDDELALLDAYWRAANYLSVGQIYLMDNPLLTEALLIYAHLNRVIKERDLNAMLVVGSGHGGPGIVANAYLEGTSEWTWQPLTTASGA